MKTSRFNSPWFNMSEEELLKARKGLLIAIDHAEQTETNCPDCPSPIPMYQKQIADIDAELELRKIKYYVEPFDIGPTIKDVLDFAIEVKYEGVWHYVLGYDIMDDTLSLMGANVGDPDINVFMASEAFDHTDIKISVEVSMRDT